MQYALSQGQVQSSSRRPAIVAGLGAALVATIITVLLTLSGGSTPVVPSASA